VCQELNLQARVDFVDYETAFSTADRSYEHILLNNTIILAMISLKAKQQRWTSILSS
jgi:hypothetical protein